MRIPISACRVAIRNRKIIVSLPFCVNHPVLTLRQLSLIFKCIQLLPSTWCNSGPKQGQRRSPRNRSLCRKAAANPAGRWQWWKPHWNRDWSQLCSLACSLRSFLSTTSQLSRAPSCCCSSYTDETRSKITFAMSQHNQLRQVMLVTTDFSRAPLELRAGQGADKKAVTVVCNGRICKKSDGNLWKRH